MSKEINLGYILIDTDKYKAVGMLDGSLLYKEEDCISAMREVAEKVLEMANEGDGDKLADEYASKKVQGLNEKMDSRAKNIYNLRKRDFKEGYDQAKQSILSVINKVK